MWAYPLFDSSLQSFPGTLHINSGIILKNSAWLLVKDGSPSAAYSLRLTRSHKSVLLGLVYTCNVVGYHGNLYSYLLNYISENSMRDVLMTRHSICGAILVKPTALQLEMLMKYWLPIYIGLLYIFKLQCSVSDFSFWLISWHNKTPNKHKK